MSTSHGAIVNWVGRSTVVLLFVVRKRPQCVNHKEGRYSLTSSASWACVCVYVCWLSISLRGKATNWRIHLINVARLNCPINLVSEYNKKNKSLSNAHVFHLINWIFLFQLFFFWISLSERHWTEFVKTRYSWGRFLLARRKKKVQRNKHTACN